MSDYNPWIGFDLDGTLAEYHGWKSWDHIGAPIQYRIDVVVELLKRGRRVKIFTARMHDAEKRDAIRQRVQAWCKEHIGQELEVTNVKDYEMVVLVDDRCIRVETNDPTDDGWLFDDIEDMADHKNED